MSNDDPATTFGVASYAPSPEAAATNAAMGEQMLLHAIHQARRGAPPAMPPMHMHMPAPTPPAPPMPMAAAMMLNNMPPMMPGVPPFMSPGMMAGYPYYAAHSPSASATAMSPPVFSGGFAGAAAASRRGSGAMGHYESSAPTSGPSTPAPIPANKTPFGYPLALLSSVAEHHAGSPSYMPPDSMGLAAASPSLESVYNAMTPNTLASFNDATSDTKDFRRNDNMSRQSLSQSTSVPAPPQPRAAHPATAAPPTSSSNRGGRKSTAAAAAAAGSAAAPRGGFGATNRLGAAAARAAADSQDDPSPPPEVSTDDSRRRERNRRAEKHRRETHQKLMIDDDVVAQLRGLRTFLCRTNSETLQTVLEFFMQFGPYSFDEEFINFFARADLTAVTEMAAEFATDGAIDDLHLDDPLASILIEANKYEFVTLPASLEKTRPLWKAGDFQGILRTTDSALSHALRHQTNLTLDERIITCDLMLVRAEAWWKSGHIEQAMSDCRAALVHVANLLSTVTLPGEAPTPSTVPGLHDFSFDDDDFLRPSEQLQPPEPTPVASQPFHKATERQTGYVGPASSIGITQSAPLDAPMLSLQEMPSLPKTRFGASFLEIPGYAAVVMASREQLQAIQTLEVRCVHRIGWLYRMMHMLVEARHWLSKALELWTAMRHWRGVTITLGALADVASKAAKRAMNVDELAKAERLGRAALKLSIREFGPKHFETGKLLKNIGLQLYRTATVLQSQKKQDKAHAALFLSTQHLFCGFLIYSRCLGMMHADTTKNFDKLRRSVLALQQHDQSTGGSQSLVIPDINDDEVLDEMQAFLSTSRR
ncbi:hypothetical protein CAOG_02235 [Capsaspora owczarzaki ATCC 30864]|uniref:Uncharacterized protein n=1 Tax=Capsaspora owczarzaki (strain ATCC 30864) TaxID=595528 RepID=A0A0D2WLY4_CAPO3|nr:hypothetical protein CAOG_02235 [Capsaspora owczarzaki ATCC 30864]KJE91033.1 hypothetical protein CAOG_002235 [Capsaspora owczarzaki ATCC 30864]|eukprot:XP_004348985.1 hypothetical protein CAOG_02235 [Capsaspora owczarzaki ATCC 30864]